LRSQLRDLDVATVKGKQHDIGVVELLWHMTADLTTVAPRPLVEAAGLELRHGTATIRLNADTSAITLGRD
jgi:hypothetical protein